MRKTILISILLVVTSVSSLAQGTDEWPQEYMNLSFVSSTIKPRGGEELNNRFGLGFTVMKTYSIGPILADMVQFGVDATWFDVNYANFKSKEIVDGYEEDFHLHQGDISLHAGPSVTFSPMQRLFFHAYFQYCPTFATLFTTDVETLYGNYSSMWAAGGLITYGPVGLGFEKRWGSVNYKALKPSDAEPFGKASLSGWRAFIAFRF